jgi:chorismate mutase
MSSLGATLFSEVTGKFFGVLTGPNAPIYLDALDAIEREMPSRGEAMDWTEAMEIVGEVLARSGALEAESDDPDAGAESDPPSAQVLRRLVGAGWIEEEKRSDYRRTLFLEPAAQTLLEALRAIVSQNIASFTGKLRLVCDRLAALGYPHSREDLPWEELKNCLALVRAGLRELRTIRKQVERYAQRQLKTASIAEALDIIYGEFSALITQQCYRELIHARLPERLREALAGLFALEQDDTALLRLQADFLRTETETDRALAEIRHTIGELSLLLGDVEPTADRVDTSTADFARRSRSRIRYIQDVGSARRQQVKVIFDFVRERLADVRLPDLGDRLDLPSPRLTDPGLIGIASLARSRRASETAARRPVDLPLSDQEREASLLEMEKNVRNALRLDRANRFIGRLSLKPGQPISSDQLPVHTEDDILDVLSCLVFAPANGSNYRLRTLRQQHPDQPVTMDPKGDFLIERFEVERK